MRNSPSIIPTDRLDRDIYLVLKESAAGGRGARRTKAIPILIRDLLSGQDEQLLRVVALNPLEGWSRDASEDVALELARRVDEEGREISEALRDFIESYTGRPIGVQLALPFRL